MTPFKKLLVSPSIVNLFIIEKFPSFSDIGHWLKNLYQEWTKPWCDHKSMRSIKSANNEDLQSFLSSGRFGHQPSLGLVSTPINKQFKQVMLTAQTFPGISYERALACANKWKSPIDMLTASIDEWANLEIETRKGRKMKFGQSNARRVMEAIHGLKSHVSTK